MRNWSVIRTRPRWEKKVVNLLRDKGIETFCPLHGVRRHWSDRIKLIQQPVIPTFVFVKITEDQRTIVRTTAGVVNFVITNCKPVVIKDKTVQKIKQLQERYASLQVMTTLGEDIEETEAKMKAEKFYMANLNLLLIGYSPIHSMAETKDKIN